MINLQLQFSSRAEFLEMGIYTFHVWSVYGLFTVFLTYNLLMPLLRRKQFLREQLQRQQRNARRSAAGTASGSSLADSNHSTGSQ
jgi:heme exporter protein D